MKGEKRDLTCSRCSKHGRQETLAEAPSGLPAAAAICPTHTGCTTPLAIDSSYVQVFFLLTAGEDQFTPDQIANVHWSAHKEYKKLGTRQLIRATFRSSSYSPLERTSSLRTKSPTSIGLHTKNIRNCQLACKRQSHNKDRLQKRKDRLHYNLYVK
jgi:hypothetical protein